VVARLLAAGQLDQRIEARPRDAADDGSVVWPDSALHRQLMTGPARPLVFEWDADLRDGPQLGQKHVLDRPVEAAGAAISTIRTCNHISNIIPDCHRRRSNAAMAIEG
jgi:hypothetical protein